MEKNKSATLDLIQDDMGLTLRGILTSQDVRRGNRRDDGKAYAIRESYISTGKSNFTFVESLDPNIDDYPPRKLWVPVVITVESANSSNGITTVRGSLKEGGQ